MTTFKVYFGYVHCLSMHASYKMLGFGVKGGDNTVARRYSHRSIQVQQFGACHHDDLWN